MKEYFDIRDSAGNPTGEVKARSLVHRDLPCVAGSEE